MTISAIRKKLKTYVDGVDDKKVKALYTLLQDEIEDSDGFSLSEEHLRILDKEHALHLNGQTKSYSWEDAKEIIRGELAFS